MAQLQPISETRIYDLVQQGAAAARQLEPDTPRRNILKAFFRHQQANSLARQIGNQFLQAIEEAAQAREQGSYVTDTFEAAGLYRGNNPNGVREKTALTMDTLRMMAHSCLPINSIIETMVSKLGEFAEEAVTKRGRAEKPGWRIAMVDREAEADDNDKAMMKEIASFIRNCGFATPEGTVRPPKHERPRSWKPGFKHFVQQYMRDSLTLDWAGIRMWPTADDRFAEQFPITTFCAVDAARLRPFDPEITGIQDGVPVFRPIPTERRNVPPEDVAWVRVDKGGSRIIEAYTGDEIHVGVRNPRTDDDMRGFGYPEQERCLNAITGWLFGVQYNIDRFTKDALPRGLMVVMGNLSQQQLDAFRMEWRSLFQGVQNRWKFPVLRGAAGQGTSVQWVPFDQNSRDMEYHQWLFTLSIWMHAAYKIHPEETGYEALSPFRPPLSEASPEVKLESSQSHWMAPALSWLADEVTQAILWRFPAWRRYKFEFVGTGQYDEAQDVQMRQLRQEASLSTPAQEWADLDLDRADTGKFKDHDAWVFPLPFAQGYQLLEGMKQQQQAQQMQMMQGMGAGGPAGGAPGAGGGMAPGMMPGAPAGQQQPAAPGPDAKQGEREDQDVTDAQVGARFRPQIQKALLANLDLEVWYDTWGALAG